MVVNHKRVERLVRLHGLGAKKKTKRIRSRLETSAPIEVTRVNEGWSMDFLSDRLDSGLSYRILAVIDRRSRECIGLEPARAMTARRVVEILDRIAAERGLPVSIRVDNGPEFDSHALREWATKNGVQLEFITPGRPTENGHIESFNGRLRQECVGLWWVESLTDARDVLGEWKDRYNNERTHSAIGTTPASYAASAPRVAYRAPGSRPDGKEENASAFSSFPQAPLQTTNMTT
jgi:putative transposase